jgi:ankyrin repeat protein
VAAEAPEDGATSLHHAAEHGDRSILRRLLQTDVGPHLGTFDYIQRTPLHCAARHGDVETARMLLEAGADVNAVNDTQTSAMHYAAQAGLDSVVTLLAEHGAKLDGKDKQGRVPADMAMGVGLRGRAGGPPTVHKGTADLIARLLAGRQ